MRWFAVGVEPVGVVAIGANATGVLAIGQLATGVVAGMVGVAWRAIGGLAWKAPRWVAAALAALWWFAAGAPVWDALSREGGIVRDPPRAACADDPLRSC